MKKKFIQNSFVYAISDVATKAVPFFIIPIVANYLSPEEYGNVSLFLTFIEITCLIMIWSGNSFYRVEYFKSKINARVIFTNSIKISFILFLLFQFLFLVLSGFYNLPAIVYLFIPLICFFKCVILMGLVYFQCEERPLNVGFTNISIALANGVCSVLLLYLGYGVDSRYYAIIISIIVPSLIIFILFFKYLTFTDRQSLNLNLKFGLPALPHSLSWWLRGGADSLIIYSFLGSASLGLYSLGQQLSLMLLVLANALNQSLAPKIFSLLTAGNKKLSRKYLTYCCLFILCMSILFITLSGLLFYFLPESYSDSKSVFILLVLSVVGRAFTIFSGNLFYFYDKMKVLSYISVVTSAVHFLVSIIMVKEYGVLGVCITGLIVYLFTFILQLYFIKKNDWLTV
jgi:O-antigen/teichoic acid export membrane protein